MIKPHIIGQGEGLIDAAINVFGSAEGVMNFWDHNSDLNLDDELEPGQVLYYDDNDIIDKDVVAYLSSKNMSVVTQLPHQETGIFDYTFDETFE